MNDPKPGYCRCGHKQRAHFTGQTPDTCMWCPCIGFSEDGPDALAEKRDGLMHLFDAAHRIASLHIPIAGRPTLTTVPTAEVHRLADALRRARGGA